MNTSDLEESRQLTEEIQSHLDARHLTEKSVRKIASLLLWERAPLMEHSCHSEALPHFDFQTHCFNWHSPTCECALRHLYVLANLCEKPLHRIKLSMDHVCLGQD
uniref:Uncharacterized protein n=1 Tax=Rhinopithecus bieti TaxID=61621 RepID=A0A2K6KCW7_RHIBE